MKQLTKRRDIDDAESLGQILQVFLISVQLNEYEHILAKHGLTEIDANTWYPLRMVLEIFEEIQKSPNGMQNLVSIGMKVTEVIDFKSQFPTFKEMLVKLNPMEKELHRNSPGEWIVQQISDNCIEIIDSTVWPHDLEFGVLYGMARLYRDEKRYTVERVAVETDPDTGDEIGIYHIEW